MPELTQEEMDLWTTHQSGRKVPGSAEPEEGTCAARINGTNKGLRDLGIQTPRYCTRTKGYGTDHKGIGTCKHHFGNAPNHQIAAVQTQVLTLVAERRKHLENPPPMKHWTVELEALARESKAYKEIAENEMLNRLSWTVITQTGKEEEAASINTYREAVKDYAEIIKFVSKQDLNSKKVELIVERAKAVGEVALKACLDSNIGLTDEQTTIIRHNLSRELRKISPMLAKDFDFDIEAEVVDDDE